MLCFFFACTALPLHLYSLWFIFFVWSLLLALYECPGTDSNPYSLDALAVFMFRVLQRVNHPVCNCVLYTIYLQLHHQTFITTLHLLTSYRFLHMQWIFLGKARQGIFKCRLCTIDVLSPLWGKGIITYTAAVL